MDEPPPERGIRPPVCFLIEVRCFPLSKPQNIDDAAVPATTRARRTSDGGSTYVLRKVLSLVIAMHPVLEVLDLGVRTDSVEGIVEIYRSSAETL